MASASPLKELEENFLRCAVCFEQYKEPKQLPCLHRFCNDCLKPIIETGNNRAINCPLCNQRCMLPDNGIDGLKTDFHMKNIIEFIKMQNKQAKECMTCVTKRNISGYCFTCRDFLCNECYKLHTTSQAFSDHHTRTITLGSPDDIESHPKLEAVLTLSEKQKCRTHPEENAKLCCSSCGNDPICVICTYSKHKGHDLNDVTELAKSERNLLEMKLAELNNHLGELQELGKTIESTKQRLTENATKMTKTLINQHNQQAQKIKGKLDKNNTLRQIGLAEMEKRKTDEDRQITLDYEKEFSQLQQKYEEMRKSSNRKYDKERQRLQQKYDKVDEGLFKCMEMLDNDMESLKATKELQTEQNTKALQDVSGYHENIMRKYESFTAMTVCVLASNDMWSDVQCIPDIRAACEPLIEEMKKKFPELECLSHVDVKDVINVKVDVKISKHSASVVYIEGIKAKGWKINGMTSSRDGNIIVITGNVSHKHSHITVMNRKGEIQRQDLMKTEKKHRHVRPYRYCSYLSEFNVVTVCSPDEIGIYDVRDGSYKKKHIADIDTSWTAFRRVMCVASNPYNDYIIVSTGGSYVEVFDDQLNYMHTITLPEAIINSSDITVHNGALLICDDFGERAYLVTMDGSESKLIHEFNKPELDEGDWTPIRACTGSNDLIYMLWQTPSESSPRRCTLAQYNHNGPQLMTTIKVDEDAFCVTILEGDDAEKILVTTVASGKMFTYCLITD